MLSFATLDEETASSCFYTLPARKGGDGKALQGPSVRLAEIALSCYGNVRAAARIISDDGKFITAQSVVHDLEQNVAVSIEVKRRVTTKDGKRYSDDMVVTTSNAACSIALRNAAYRVVPRALITPVYDAARRVAVGDAKSLATKRAAVIDRLKQMGAKLENILRAVGASKVEDVDLSKLELLIGLGTSIKDGAATIEEAFPEPETAPRPIFNCQEPEPTPPADDQIPGVEVPPAPLPEPVQSEQDKLANIVTTAGHNFDRWLLWAKDEGFVTGDPASFDEIDSAAAAKLVKSSKGMLAKLTAYAGGDK
jgi:hypothetical protein